MRTGYSAMLSPRSVRDREWAAEKANMDREMAITRRLLAAGRGRGSGARMMACRRKAAVTSAAAAEPVPYVKTVATPGFDFIRDPDPRSEEALSAKFSQLMDNWAEFRAVGAHRVSPKRADAMNGAFRQEATWLQQSINAAR